MSINGVRFSRAKVASDQGVSGVIAMVINQMIRGQYSRCRRQARTGSQIIYGPNSVSLGVWQDTDADICGQAAIRERENPGVVNSMRDTTVYLDDVLNSTGQWSESFFACFFGPILFNNLLKKPDSIFQLAFLLFEKEQYPTGGRL